MIQNTKKRVLITGLEGFTGQYMAAEMESAGYQVIGLGMLPSKTNYFHANLTDLNSLKTTLAAIQPDYVIHLAACSFVGDKNSNAFYQVNLIGTRNLLEAIAECDKPIHGILLASSANIYGNASEGMLDENTPPAPVNDYAVSKYAMELMARLWMDRLPIIITRPFNYTGIGQPEHFLIPKIVSHFQQKKNKIELGNLDIWRDFSDVRDVVRIYRQLLEANAYGHILNICSGKMYSLRDIIKLCEQLTGQPIAIRVNPAFARANEVKKLYGNSGNLNKLINKKSFLPLEKTLEWMLQK